MNNLTYFVPVDFSDCSYRAVQYATLLAKMFGGRIELFHVTDTKEIMQYDSPMSTIRTMDDLTRKAVNKMRSLCEMISETWQIPVHYSLTIGDTNELMLSEIQRKYPDVIVFGKGKKGNSLLKKILTHIHIPVFVIPPGTEIKEPSSIILTTDLQPVNSEAMKLLANLARRSPQGLSLLDIQEEDSLDGKEKKEWVEDISKQFDVSANFLAVQDKQSPDGILDRIRSTCTDLLCIVKREENDRTEIPAKDITVQLALKAEVATLVITDSA